MGIRCADHVTPLYLEGLALTSPTGGGRSVGIVRSRTKATEFSSYVRSEMDGWTDVPYSQAILRIVNCWNYVALPESQSVSLQDVSSLMLVIIRFTTAFQLPHSSYLFDSMIYGTPSFSLPLRRLVKGLH